MPIFGVSHKQVIRVYYFFITLLKATINVELKWLKNALEFFDKKKIRYIDSLNQVV